MSAHHATHRTRGRTAGVWRTLRSSEAETELRAVVATDANRDTRDDAEPVRPESVPRALRNQAI